MVRIVLHIGTEKTATTSIQWHLYENRKLFAEKGVLYPEKLGGENHLCFPALAIGRPDADEITTAAYALMKRFGYDAMDKYVLETLDWQIAASKPDTILLSNEHLHSRITTTEQVHRLKRLLSTITDNIEIVLYIRRQDRLAVSYYSTPFKFGKKTVDRVIPDVAGQLPHYYDYGKIVTQWSEVFGKDNITVRIFEEEVRAKGGIINSFLNAARVTPPKTQLAKTHNESLSLEAIHFLASFNEKMDAFPDRAGELRKLRNDLVRFLERNYPAARKLASRDAAKQFLARCKPSNDIVLKSFFPQRDRLFDENFNEYGGEEILSPDPATLAEIGARAAMAVGTGFAN
ncbi:hypothetical protein [Roseibium aggregatum]|uniref:Sulfotransferase domain-containing protein n=1 Tax=Roseibium aggregatum TaxID=187304 RepID=A0A939EK76_9HYPH|nr:hypothetical protein [Roseibium aggregatum]MBN9673838.1 hypothetical protein [Roseibium aggregatum]